MIRDFSYTFLLGQPVFIWFGIMAFAMMLMTAVIAILNHKGIHVIPFKYHPWCATATITFTLVHVFLIVASRLGW
jgi:hypothetical protein